MKIRIAKKRWKKQQSKRVLPNLKNLSISLVGRNDMWGKALELAQRLNDSKAT